MSEKQENTDKKVKKQRTNCQKKTLKMSKNNRKCRKIAIPTKT